MQVRFGGIAQGNLTADATLLPKKRSSRRSGTNAAQRLLIRNRYEVIAYSTLIIAALQEALDYDPARHHNQPLPALWIEDPKYLKILRALVAELKRLNALLQANHTRGAEPKRTVIDIRKHINILLDNYVPIFAKGTACITVAAMAGLLRHFGVEADIVVGILTAANLTRPHAPKRAAATGEPRNG